MQPSPVGRVHTSGWLAIDQDMIDRFADNTGDHNFIHVDPVRAAQTPFGGSVAHGFLLLSLLTRLVAAAPFLSQAGVGVNYGFDKIRFVAPVPAGARVRAVATLTEALNKQPGHTQMAIHVVMEIEGAAKPALIADWLVQFISAP